MEIKYDKEIDAKYVYIKKGKIARTKKEQDWLLFDYAENGDVLGVEILDASRHLVSFFTVAGKLVGHSITESRSLQNGQKIMDTKVSTEGSSLVIA
jgi:uncharacterized protein YuzE